MITYQSNLYYYFVLTAIAIFSFLKVKITKSQSLLIINILFHATFFYYNKKQFIQFQVLLFINYLAITFYQRSRASFLKSNNVYLPVCILLNLSYFILIRYSLWNLTSRLGFIAFVGFSFFTFRLISLYTDLKRELIKEKIGLIDYYNYLTFFPIFLSGPLNRFTRFIEDIYSTTINTPLQQFNYTYRIIWGIFKKVVIADYLLDFSIDSIHISDLYHLASYKILISMYLYSLVLYLDFSGYSDVGIGICGLFGITVPENFNKPFSSKNIQEFWNRWHISFMHWLRDYLYYPIQVFTLRNKIITSTLVASIVGYITTFLAAGLWHGNQRQYLYYGLYHGMAFSLYLTWKNLIQKKLTKEQKNRYYSSKTISLASIVITYHYFIFGLFFFIGKYEYFFKALKDL